MSPRASTFRRAAAAAVAAFSVLAAATLVAAPAAVAAGEPWTNTSLTPEARADLLVAAMTTAEKLTMLHGGTSCGYAGCIDANTRLGIPALHLQDGPVGPGDGFTGVTQLAAPVAGAATWDTALMRQYGDVIGAEQKGKGTNVQLGPTVNIIRDPRWGRAFESFGEDPYLAGQIGVADIQGVQGQGVMAQVKHYVANNQESNRMGVNAVVGDRAMREIYTPAFEAAVKGGVDSAMCSYNLINGPYACESAPTLNGILKGDLGFKGFVTSDWGATHSTVASATNGLDMEMPDARFFGGPLTTAVNNGQVSMATINDKVKRITTSMFRRGLFDRAPVGSTGAVVTTPAHVAVARQVATQGSVLLKNANGVLPFTSATKNVAVIGSGGGSGAMYQGGGSANVNPSGTVSPLDGLRARAGSAVNVTYAPGSGGSDGALPAIDTSYLTPVSGTGHGLTVDYFNNTTQASPTASTRVEPAVDYSWNGSAPVAGLGGVNWSGRWTGKVTPPTTGTYTFSLTSDDGSRLFVNGQKIVDMWNAQASTTRTGTINLTAGQAVTIQVDYFQAGGGSNLTLGWQVAGQSLRDQAIATARTADVAVVFANKFESEGSDVGDIELPAAQNQLIADVAAANPNTVVVVNSGSAVTMPWAGSVRGIVEAWYPGQDYGNALASLLFGDSSFSGKLPVTFPKSLADVPANTAAQFPGTSTVQYSEGINVGYRWYDSKAIAPAFPFGFGLSYTTFGYGNLTVGAPDGAGNVAVSFDVTNTGTRAGAEVAQVYVTQPSAAGEAPRNLRGFSRIQLNPGQTQRATVTLDARSFQYWAGSWTKAPGTQTVSVGSSSRDIRLTGTVPGSDTGGGGGGGGGGTDPSTPLPRAGWTVTASSTGGGDVPARAIDGSLTTRWSTGVPMANGQSVTIDLGSVQPFGRIDLDAGGSAADYPRGYQVFVSNDGASWGSAVATGTGSSALVSTTFPTQNARYIRVVQTGAASSWWSIAELNVYGAGGTTPVTPVVGVLRGAESGRCVDVPGANAVNGAAVQLYDCNGTGAQQFTATASNQLTVLGKCLDVSGGSTADGSAAIIGDCATGGTSQQWTVNADGTVVGVPSGRCLEATSHGTANGTKLRIATCTGATNQKWARS
ncbi:glycoside hydrolase family 3 C-terminal domain-containing protein [Cellulomonas sp. URHD0024]|uniref:glycoside hydrolase family 3 C-terminal domain-containing protein n=1 Tax=Cellulomonas sp. URHD0024 TaxID=1302620 RepID=UPI00041E6109|nr:glycoside hydrolase family 3 C-terminal domain-containing protein [Cellulomonas sp. URHD0024]